MRQKLFATLNDPSLTIARLVLAAVFFAHGSQKMFGLFGGRGVSGTIDLFQQSMGIPAALTILVMCTEVFGSLGMFLGLFSRVAALGQLGIMIVAPIASHYNHFFMNWTGRLMNEGFEYHLLAIALLLGILIRGGGALSVDRVIANT